MRNMSLLPPPKGFFEGYFDREECLSFFLLSSRKLTDFSPFSRIRAFIAHSYESHCLFFTISLAIALPIRDCTEERVYVCMYERKREGDGGREKERERYAVDWLVGR
ncbi:hypothetical protein PUN28_016829 [Cardiocondyla obscurior]|uniref:Uncharacterized protein n=1 Tax=Cardiocondyla obscurior TaxID=286306 RepID=A0AAW2ET64_9HYME